MIKQKDLYLNLGKKKLYQVVNENKSALVIAPTSAGKTFISFYCMEKIIRQSNEDIVVYVAPTKAIGNQVRADVYARFTKKYKHNNVRLTGVFTRDLRVDPLDCQILITVPEAFKILLTAPSTVKWRKKIKYVIFDEIHSISSSDGIVWEQLLISIRCPFLGLSATIGNPDDFAGWLRKILIKKGEQDGVKYELDVISHSERYSHLEYNLLQVPKLDPMTKDEALELTKLNNQTDLLPKYYKERTKKFFNYQYPLSFVECQQSIDNMLKLFSLGFFFFFFLFFFFFFFFFFLFFFFFFFLFFFFFFFFFLFHFQK